MEKITKALPSALARSHSISFALTAMAALTAPLIGGTARATTCIDSVTAVTCTGSGSTPMVYVDRNIVFTLDGSGVPMTVPLVDLSSLTNSSSPLNDDRSITTIGAVTPNSTNNTIHTGKWEGTGDLSVFIG